MMRTLHSIGQVTLLSFTLLACGRLTAGENAILTTGFRIHADRHETSGETVKLYSGDGCVELQASQIAGYEQEEYVPPSAKPAEAAPPIPVQTAKAEILDPKHLAAEAARRANLPEALIRSVMHAESGFHAEALSPKGAIGLMQLMPATALELHADPRDPKQNVEAGTAYLRSLLVKYEDHDDQVARAVAAYNAGPGAVDRYNGVPPYPETRDYVIRVLKEYQQSLLRSPIPDAAAATSSSGQ